MGDPSQHPDLIRRKAEPWSVHVHEFLVYLERVGFEGSPLSLGITDGFESVMWIDGWASSIPFDGPLSKPDGLASVGRLLRRFHRAAADYVPASDALWAGGAIPFEEGMIVRHGDVGAGNIIWNFGEATAFIDWEFAQPGYPIDDVALAAWLLAPLVPLDGQIKAGFPTGAPLRKRLDALARGYRDFTVSEILEAYRDLLEFEHGRRKKLGLAGVEPWAGYIKNGQLKKIEDTVHWYETRGKARILK